LAILPGRQRKTNDQRATAEDGRRGETGRLEFTVEQEFAIPFPAEDGGFDCVSTGAALGLQALANFFDGGGLYRRIAHDAALSYLLASGFELGFDEDYDLPALTLLGCWPRCGDDCGQNQSGGDERHVHDHEVDGFAYLLRGEVAGVSFFQQPDAPILAESKVDLAMSGVDGDDASGTALQEAIGKAAG